ncbi:short transient receptor potential channel 4-like [Branchiostoma floridae]|uniref:Short transient receptor potential channel 4-like n=1 Tax=Branchiostoma floridae TaxID=7739 RepID=A0A9J7L8A0_BRAFL|nr:short transient receptor potential channel 4-like [Branchiostoma floridae]
MTPVMLAAMKNNYDILEMLLQAGFPTLETDAYQWTTSISQAKAWLDAYRAVCSPSYILLTSPDPFRTAFRTAKALRDVCWKREQYRPELEQLADQCETFACELLEEVCTTEELDILGHTDDPEGMSDESVGTLQLAVDLKQRQFSTQPLCVEYLALSRVKEAFEFHEVFGNWEKMPVVYAALWGIAIQLSYPLLCLAYIIAPDSRIGKFSRLHFIREHSWNMSWFMLMALLLIETQYYQVGRVEIDSIVRGTPLLVPYTEVSVAQTLIMLWVAGILLEELQEVQHEGLGRYFRQFWNILDFTLVALYLAQMALRLVAYVQLGVYDQDTVATQWMIKASPHTFEPVAVADVLFSLFTITVFMRSLSIFSHYRYLGTLMISIGRMFADIVNFISMDGVVTFAFACGLNQLYWYYGTVHEYLCEEYSKGNLKTVDCQRSHGFSTILKTVESLFWATFGITDLSMLELDPDSSTLEALRIMEQPVLTETVGKLIFVLFHATVVLVLLNLLIAIMSDSYQRTQDEKRRDWTFSIVKDMLFYMRVDLSLAPPFNLLLLVKTSVSRLLCAVCRQGNRRSPHSAIGQGSVHPSSPSKQERQEKYKMMIDRLVNRYLLRKERETENQR